MREGCCPWRLNWTTECSKICKAPTVASHVLAALVVRKIYCTFAAALEGGSSGYSAVRLAHLLWEQRAASSNLATPTPTNGRRVFLYGRSFM